MLDPLDQQVAAYFLTTCDQQGQHAGQSNPFSDHIVAVINLKLQRCPIRSNKRIGWLIFGRIPTVLQGNLIWGNFGENHHAILGSVNLCSWGPEVRQTYDELWIKLSE